LAVDDDGSLRLALGSQVAAELPSEVVETLNRRHVEALPSMPPR
jgi:hypothetical protein